MSAIVVVTDAQPFIAYSGIYFARLIVTSSIKDNQASRYVFTHSFSVWLVALQTTNSLKMKLSLILVFALCVICALIGQSEARWKGFKKIVSEKKHKLPKFQQSLHSTIDLIQSNCSVKFIHVVIYHFYTIILVFRKELVRECSKQQKRRYL